MRRKYILDIVGLFISLSATVASAEYTINSHPIKDYVDVNKSGFQVVGCRSANEDDTAIIQMNNKSMTIRWAKVDLEYNDLGAQKKAAGSGVVCLSKIASKSWNDRGGLLGFSEQDVVLTFDSVKFEETSLTFKDRLQILPFSKHESAFYGLEIRKRSGVTYPFLKGNLDFNRSESILQKFKDEPGFLIVGCDVSFIFDVSKL